MLLDLARRTVGCGVFGVTLFFCAIHRASSHLTSVGAKSMKTSSGHR